MATPFRHPRTGVYYIRRAVPEDLREAIGKAEYKKSLGTKDPTDAKKRFPAALHECEAAFARAREGRAVVDVLSDQQIREAGEAWAAHILGEDDDVRLEGLDDRAYARSRSNERPLRYWGAAAALARPTPAWEKTSSFARRQSCGVA